MTPLAQVYDLLSSVLELLTDDASDCQIDPLPCRTAVYLGGEVPWDTCGNGGCNDRDGMLWAQLTGLTPAQGGTDSGSCPAYMWTAEIGVVRCVATLDNAGNPPSPEQVAADALQQVQDADQIFYALRCCPTRPEALADVGLSAWNPVGPNGGCAGGTWTMRGRLDACC